MLVKSENSGSILIPDNLSVDSLSGFRNSLTKCLDRKPTRILLDCSALEHVTSSHINLLWQARMMCQEFSIPLVLKSVSENMISVLKVLDLFEEFEIETQSFPDTLPEQGGAEQIGDGELKLEFDVDSKNISANLIEFRDFLKKINASAERLVEMETVFYEVVTNIRLHSGLGPQDVVSFHALSKSGRITLEFVDSGIAFDPTAQDVAFIPKEAMKDGKRRGFGLIMITRMGGHLSYQYRDGKYNVLTMEKQWSAK